jgi:hypothetical protein
MATGTQWLTTQPNTWLASFAAGTSANSNLLGVVNNQMTITGIKLEASASCTPLTVRPFEADYHDCVRYYFTTFTYQSVTAGFPIAATAHLANAAVFNFQFARRMCKIPTVVPYGWTSNTAGKVTNVSTGVDYTVATIGAVAKGVVGNPAGLTAAKGDVFLAFITADARLS